MNATYLKNNSAQSIPIKQSVLGQHLCACVCKCVCVCVCVCMYVHMYVPGCDGRGGRGAAIVTWAAVVAMAAVAAIEVAVTDGRFGRGYRGRFLVVFVVMVKLPVRFCGHSLVKILSNTTAFTINTTINTDITFLAQPPPRPQPPVRRAGDHR